LKAVSFFQRLGVRTGEEESYQKNGWGDPNLRWRKQKSLVVDHLSLIIFGWAESRTGETGNDQ